METPVDSPVGLCFRHIQTKELNGFGFETTYRIDHPQYPLTPGQRHWVATMVSLYCSDEATYGASISHDLEVLDEDDLKNMERITKDEYDNQFYRAIQAITQQHRQETK